MNDIKYVFVCGLHRSGTTHIAQSIGRLRSCTSFEGTGVVMDEGQFLQDVYPPDDVYGGGGRFGLASKAHLTERSPLLTQKNITRLRQSWETHWDQNKTIRIEKTPGNLLMTRFLQAAFENAYFVVIRRHPVPVSLATQKWTRDPVHRLFEHWLRCYMIFDEDKHHLNHLYELRYEDYMNDPAGELSAIAEMLGTVCPPISKGGRADLYNKKYLDRWAYMLQRSCSRTYYRHVAKAYEGRFAPHGYSIMGPLGGTAFLAGQNGPLQRAAGASLRFSADVCSLFWRADLKVKQFLIHHPITAGLVKRYNHAQLTRPPKLCANESDSVGGYGSK
jgi:hypothetical protein